MDRNYLHWINEYLWIVITYIGLMSTISAQGTMLYRIDIYITVLYYTVYDRIG